MLFLIWIMGPKTSLESSAQGYYNYFIFQVSSTFIYKGTVLLMFFVLKKKLFCIICDIVVENVYTILFEKKTIRKSTFSPSVTH